MKTVFASTLIATLAVSVCAAQSYRCDWSVIGMGGGEMSGAAHKCVSTAGQTAAGFMTSSDYWALVGFWQPEGATGVREQAYSPSPGQVATRLYAPRPNPFGGRVVIRYSLAGHERVSLRIYDQTGRVVREFPALGVKRGAYSVSWDGRDNTGRALAAGVYFLKFLASDYRQTEKLVLQR